MQYFHATQAQASALFMRFYGWPSSNGSFLSMEEKEKVPTLSTEPPPFVDLQALASQFASKIPMNTFSTAELQGYLLLHKKVPEDAVLRGGWRVSWRIGRRMRGRSGRERRGRGWRGVMLGVDFVDSLFETEEFMVEVSSILCVT